MKKIVTMGLVILFLSGIVLPISFTWADEGSRESSDNTAAFTEAFVNTEITEWIMDEGCNTLYAISPESKEVIFINGDTLNIDNRLSLNGVPADLVKEKDKLYIPLSDKQEIAVVDLNARKIIKTLQTTANPARMVVNEDKLYYIDNVRYATLHEYNLVNNEDKVLKSSFFTLPDLAINKEKNLLYLGEYDTSGAILHYYSLEKNQVISTSNYNDNIGFMFPTRTVIFYGDYVYYANRDFTPENAERINGNFEKGEGIVFVKDDLVYTNTSIYERTSHKWLGDSVFNMDLVQAADKALYIYNKASGVIRRFYNESENINNSNVLSLISGNPAPKLEEDTKSTIIDKETVALDIGSNLTEWVLDEESNTLYAISNESKALFFINRSTLNIEKALTFTSGPTDIIKEKGKIYVALNDISQIAVIDMGKREVQEILYTAADVYKMVKNNEKIYYTPRDQWVKLHEFDLGTKTDTILTNNNFYYPDIAINKEKNILYIGEAKGSGCEMYYYNLEKDEIMSRSYYNNGAGFMFPERSILFDGANVFYYGKSFHPEEASTVIKDYSGATVIFVNDNYVFTGNSVYNKKTGALIRYFGSGFKLVESVGEKEYYIYSEKRIYKRGAVMVYEKEDINKDGKIDMLDVDAVALNYNNTDKETNWEPSKDLNNDGIIDVYDLILVSKKIQQ